MGLDFVELVMEVEDHFGIRIRSDEYPQVRTVGNLVEVIQSRIIAAQTLTCPLVPAFRKLQTQGREVKGDDRFRVRMRTRVVDCFSPAEIKRLWAGLQELDGGLELPQWLRRLSSLLMVAMFTVAFVAAVSSEILLLPVTMFLAGVLSVILIAVMHRYRAIPPSDLATFGAITRRIASATVATKLLHLKSRDEVFEELRPIVAKILGVKPADIIPSARFIEDLGMG